MPISLPHIISDPRQFVRRIFISASQRPHNGTFVALAKEAPHGREGSPLHVAPGLLGGNAGPSCYR